MPKQQAFDPLGHELPSDVESEKALIGSSISHEARLREAVVRVRPEHMSTDANRIVWSWVCDSFDAGEPVSGGHLTSYFSTGPGKVNLSALGGLTYLSGFYHGIDMAVDRWASYILETYARRQMISKCHESMLRLYSRQEPIAEISHSIEEECRNSIALTEPSSGFKNFEDMIRECGGINAFLSRGKGDSLSYPWPSLNRMTKGGMKPKQLITIAGQSGKGKTALVLNIMLRASQMGRGIPLLFSLEMDMDEIGERMLALASGVDTYRFDSPTNEERELIRKGRQRLTDHTYLVDDEDAANMTQIYSRTKQECMKNVISMVVIDTIQLVEGGRKGVRENREQELATISRQMKRMAMKLDLPVIALSQINDLDFGKEPELKNLRESRAIGHNSNIVMFLHFTRAYNMAAGVPTGDLDLILAKHRGGPEGRVKLEFHAPTGSFYERETGDGQTDR